MILLAKLSEVIKEIKCKFYYCNIKVTKIKNLMNELNVRLDTVKR